jgi:hypothetical protein
MCICCTCSTCCTCCLLPGLPLAPAPSQLPCTCTGRGLADGRFSLTGTVKELPEADKAAAREVFLKKYPDAFWVDFGDFRWGRGWAGGRPVRAAAAGLCRNVCRLPCSTGALCASTLSCKQVACHLQRGSVSIPYLGP